MAPIGTLLDFLTSRSPDQLAGILRRRPDATWGAPIAGLPDLAERLSTAVSLNRAFFVVPEPCLQLLHGITALGPSTTLPALLALIGDTGDPVERRDGAVIDHLRVLQDLAAIWLDGDHLGHDPALAELIPRPIGIGLNVATWLERLSRSELTTMAGACGLKTSGSGRTVAGRLVALLTDPDRVRAMVGQAPAAVRQHLEQLATAQANGEQVPHRGRADLEGDNWARRRGLLFGGQYYSAEVPVEVALAVMKSGALLPFAARPPQYPPHAVAPPAIDRGAAAAAADATQSVASLIDRLSRTPAAGLKAGGVGSRELIKIGKALGVDESRVRFDLEILRELGVLAGGEGSVGVAPAAADWRAADPAERFADIVAIWWTLPVHPTIGRDGDDKPIPAAGRRVVDVSAEQLRGVALSLIDELGPEHALGDAAALAGQLAWRRPLARPYESAVAAIWQEAHALGVLVDGAVSPVGRCLLDRDADELLAVGAALLPAATSSGRFGSDLTVLVPGSPSASVSALLDSCADREGRGAAVVWRFSPTSVRRAFDEGWTGDELTGALRGIADTELPQTLTYLIADVARRHGHLIVLPAASVVRSADPALLREVVAHRTLAVLQPHLVTGEVAMFQHPPAKVVDALRAAGYLPVAADEHGVVDLRRAAPASRRTHHAAGPAGRPRDRLAAGSASTGPAPGRRTGVAVDGLAAAMDDRPDIGAGDALTLAGRLLRAADASAPDQPASETETYVDLFAPQLRPLERRQLAFAIDQQLPVVITYRNAGGNISRRTISDLELVGDHLYAWCHLRDDQREFNIGRISEVQPATR